MTEAAWQEVLRLASGLGVAAMGVVQALKAVSVPVGKKRWTSLSHLGLGKCREVLGKDGMTALCCAYGATGFDLLLEGAWREGAAAAEVFVGEGLMLAARTPGPGQKAICARLGRSEESLTELLQSVDPSDGCADLRSVLFAHAKAAVSAGRDRYALGLQLTASAIALGGSFLMAWLDTPAGESPQWFKAFVVGVVAVPLAPVAKDLAAIVANVRKLLPGLIRKR